MSEINRAYELLERDRRRAADGARPLVGVGPGRADDERGRSAAHPATSQAPAGSLLDRVERARFGDSPIIDFGEYAGWRIADVARVDPQYLRWLSRHSAGVRYRSAIAEVLGHDAAIGRRATIVR
jgi:microcystin degradation protein MlrC